MSSVTAINATPQVLSKTINESIFYTFSFANHLSVSGGSLTGTPTVVCQLPPDSNATLLTIGTPVQTTTSVQVLLTGGTSSNTYLLRCLASDTLGEVLECCGGLLVT